MNSWQIGDVAVITNPMNELWLKGFECEIRSDLIDGEYEIFIPELGYSYGESPDDWFTTPPELSLPPHPNEVTTWDTCEFQPKELIVAEEDLCQ